MTTKLANISQGFAEVINRETGEPLGSVEKVALPERRMHEHHNGLDGSYQTVEVVEVPRWEARRVHELGVVDRIGHFPLFETRAEAVEHLARLAE